MESNNYPRLRGILEILQQKTKDLEETIIPVFGIEVDTNVFTTRLLFDKLHKIFELSETELKKSSITLCETQLLTSFLSFFAKEVRLGKIFIRPLWNFMAQYSLDSLGIRQRISWQVRDNLSWWNNLLLKLNSVLIFDNKRWETYLLYTYVLLVDLGGFYYKYTLAFWTDVMIEQNTAFFAMAENCKSDYLLDRSRESMILALPQGRDV